MRERGGWRASGEIGTRSGGLDEEKEADDDDGYKGGCPSSFSSAAAANPSGDRAAAVYGLPGEFAVGDAPVGNLTRIRRSRAAPRAEAFIIYFVRFRADKNISGDAIHLTLELLARSFWNA